MFKIPLKRWNLSWLYYNPTRISVKNIESLFKLNMKSAEVNEQWEKLKVAETEAAVKQILNRWKESKSEVDDWRHFEAN